MQETKPKLIVTIPHGSAYIPDDAKPDYIISEEDMDRHIDFGTHQVFALPCADRVIEAEVSRFYVDVNRARNDFYGLGVIITRSWDGKKVLKKDLIPVEVEERLKRYYDPFYEKLETALACEENVVLLAGHSMSSVGDSNAPDPGQERPEIMIATHQYESVSRELVEKVKGLFEERGYTVWVDKPYGTKSFFLKKYGKPPKVEALGIEVNKRLYMDEDSFKVDLSRCVKINRDITEIFCRLTGKD